MDWPAVKKRSQHNQIFRKNDIKQLKFVDFSLLIMLMSIICMNSHDMMSSLIKYIWKKISNQQYEIFRFTV